MEEEEEAWRGRISKLWEQERSIGYGVGGGWGVGVEVTEEKMAPSGSRVESNSAEDFGTTGGLPGCSVSH